MSHHKKSKFISGNLVFSGRKVLLKNGENSYFVRFLKGNNEYVHGDMVRARLKVGTLGNLPEVEVLSLESRSHELLLGRYSALWSKKKISIIRELGNVEWEYQGDESYENGDLLLLKFTPTWRIHVLWKFSNENIFDEEERILFFIAWITLDFDQRVINDAEKIQKEKDTLLKYALRYRADFRDRYVFTIDGSDAKDLDDAISIERKNNGEFVLGVHIADVAEYVSENSVLDKNAYRRATSIYTPGKVIPMLPEALSNDLCSLHPGEPKLTLSVLMTIDSHGQVKHTDIVEGVIESKHRGVYEDIQKRYESLIQAKNDSMLSPLRSLENKDGVIPQNLDEAIPLSYSLYHILKKRRKKEGKIIFESAEMSFEFGDKSLDKKIVPTNIKLRSRVDAHMLIEEFMVLTNEEVAKWCDAHQIPFLSRVHDAPPYNSQEILRKILASRKLHTQKSESKKGKHQPDTLSPSEIRDFLDILDEDDLYRYSRLMLPKMAKALYRDKKHRHFGLALEYYSHFTSPIRRYPDLQIHRIIKEEIRGKLDPNRTIHYSTLLKKVAKHCSEKERWAEDIERAFDSLYACRYMMNHIGDTYIGRVSGITEFAYFVELDNGVEATIYLPRGGRYRVDEVFGILTDTYGRKIASIGDKKEIQILDVLEQERRIIGELHVK